jgi:hypothetical protein
MLVMIIPAFVFTSDANNAGMLPFNYFFVLLITIPVKYEIP